ncbi:MAG: hypothetical protein NTZ36_03655 [Candidatus Jorgensenbacteria bacterium]|nr:hypothetical protein [Candidatus Jorgensenbacteria bacterium]
MKIKWNEVTTLSKTVALIVFIALPFIAFYLGIKYQELVQYGNCAPMSFEGAIITNK